MTVQDNVITTIDGDGVMLNGSGAIVTGNVISGSRYGVIVNAPTATVTSNVFESNVTGILVINNHAGPASSAVIEANYVVNSNYGISTEGVDVTVNRNVLASNVEVGVFVMSSNATVITSNNFTANGAGGARCGVKAYTDTPVNAEKNYWASAQGPGAGNADTTCKITLGAPVDSTPFLTKAVVITNTTGR